MSKTLLLTGGTGFVGRNLLLRCLQTARYQRIIALVRDPEKLRMQLRAEGYESLPGALEISDFSFDKHHVADHVVHGAGVLFSRSRADYQKANVEGTRRILASLAGTPRVVLISSQSAGGPTPIGKSFRTETTPDHPLTEYGRSKRDMESLALRDFGSMSPLILRAPMILGPRDQATRPLFEMARSRIRVKPGMRSKSYSWIAVDDLINAIFAALDSDEKQWSCRQRMFYVTGADTLTDASLISGAVKACGGKLGLTIRLPQPMVRILSGVVDLAPHLRTRLPSLTRDRAREIWPWRWLVSSERFQEQFVWSPKHSLPEVLQNSADWFCKSAN